MRKIILSIIIIGLLFSTTPLSIAGKENINLPILKSVESKKLTLIDNSMWSPDLFVPGELIVKFKDNVDVSISMTTNENLVSESKHSGSSMGGENTGGQTSSPPQEIVATGIESIDKLNLKYGVSSAEKLVEDDSIPEFLNVYKFTVYADVSSALEEYLNDSNVEFAEPNYVYHLMSIPNDPYFGLQWALNNTGQNGGTPGDDIHALEAWNIQKGSPNVVIAIIDTGVDAYHPDLAGNIVQGSTDVDWCGHGTHCAGIAAAVTNNGIGVAGVARGCKIMPQLGMSKLVPLLSEFMVTKCIINATKEGADVISMSLGGPYEGVLMDLAIAYADSKGVVIVAAAGNELSNVPSYPGANKKVIAVAATDNNDSMAFFSNYGGWVDVAAPGVNIYSTMPTYNVTFNEEGLPKNYSYMTGTSMSCPQVAGVAALVLSQKPNLTPQEVRTILRSSTDPVNSTEYIGTGRISAYKAVQKAAAVVAEFDDSIDEKDVRGVVDIKGIAKGTGFQKYVLEYSKGVYKNDWKQIAASYSPNYGITPLSGSGWDTTKLDEGLYTIRLTVTTSNGLTYQDMTVVRVDNKAESYYVDKSYNPSTPGWGHDHFNTITAAIDQCGSKDTINVHSGNYYENLGIGPGRSVNLIGQNKDNTLIDSTSIWWASATVSISHSSIKISGFKITPAGVMALVTSNSEIKGNKFIGQGLDIAGVITSSDNIISGNTFTGSASIGLMCCKKNTISGNTVSNGIDIIISNKNDIHNNVIAGGFSISVSDFNDIYGNDITGGISLEPASFSNIHDNTISGGSIGINLEQGIIFPSSFNLITGNTIKNNNYGIYMLGFDHSNKFNTISKNNISNSQQYGLYIDDMTNNTEIYYNNFFENSKNAYDGGHDNVWCKPLLMLGNYWDDYQTKYPNAHPRTLMPWLWDTPYDIDGGSSQDLYPLVNQYDSSASYNSESYQQSQPGSQPSNPN